MPEPQQQDQGPWTKYGPPSASPEEEGPWTKFAPAEPEKPPEESFLDRATQGKTGFWETVKHAVNPINIASDASESLGKAAEWAGRKRTEAEQENLAGVAAGKPSEQVGPYSKAGTYDLMNRALRTASGLAQPQNIALVGAAAVAPEIVGPAMLAHGALNAASEAPQAFRGDPEATERMLQSASEAAGGGALAGGALTTRPTMRQSLAESTTGKAIRPVGEIAQEAISRLKTPEAQKALTQATQPGVRIPKAQESIAIAGPRIQQIRQASGVEIPAKGPEALKAVLDLNKQAKTQILQAIEDRMGPVADLRPNASSVAKGIRGSVDDLTIEQTPGLRESMERRAGIYEKEGGSNWTIRQMEERMHTLNNRLANAYTQVTPGEARISAETEMDLAEARELRGLIDKSVENLSGAGVKDLKREYGAQRDLEKGLARQYAVATRTKGAPLWEGLAYLQAAGDVMSGNVLGAARAAGRIMVGNRLQMLRDAGYLANQAFHGPKAFKAAEPIPPHQGPPAPKGLLPAPATQLPGGAPDTSGSVRGGRYTTPAALLPEEQPIEAEFIPRRVPATPARAGVNRMLPESTTPQTNIPPAVSPEFAREVIGKMNFQRTEQGPPVSALQRPVKGELPPPKEGSAAPKPPTPTGKISSETAKKAIQAAKRGGKTAEPTKPTGQLEKLEAGKTPAYVAAAAKEARAMPAGYQPGEQPGMGFFQFHDPELGGSFYIREGQVSVKAIKDAMEARKKTIEPSPLVTEKTENVKREMAKREGKSENELLEAQSKIEKPEAPAQPSGPKKPWDMSEAERKAEVARLREENRSVLSTPLMSEGEISPAQVGSMSKRQHERWSDNAQKRMEIESQIRTLESPERLAAAKERSEKAEAEERDRKPYLWTREEWLSKRLADKPPSLSHLTDKEFHKFEAKRHAKSVKIAVESGKDVRADVLADYPEFRGEVKASQESSKLPPVQSVTPPEDLAHAEGIIRQEVGVLQSVDKPGRYFDESTPGEHTLGGRRRPGERMGGMWRGVKSIRHQMPFLREHPEVSAGKAAEAMEKDGTNPTYQKLMRAALDFIKRQKPAQ